jgi:tRNA threonylcarbamoyladenosine biosynthesis protein TsaB
MLILTIRSDKPEAEIGVYTDSQPLILYKWLADRQLAETIHLKIKETLSRRNYDFQNVQGIVVYQGPGSFTGLRISISVANALAYSLSIPIIGSTGSEWTEDGINQLLKGKNSKIVIPEYGAAPHITKPKK